MKIGRNDPCHCGSGEKYKKCCRDKDDAARAAEALAKAAEAGPAPAADPAQAQKTKAAVPRAVIGAPPRPRLPTPPPPRNQVRRRAV